MKILYYEDGAKNTVFLTNNPIFEGPQLYNISFFKKTISVSWATHNTCILSDTLRTANVIFKYS